MTRLAVVAASAPPHCAVCDGTRTVTGHYLTDDHQPFTVQCPHCRAGIPIHHYYPRSRR